MIKIGLIGHPVAQSKSAIIHEYWLKKHGLDGAYNLIDVAPDDLAARIKQLQAEGYNGVNVTVPHKQAAMEACDSISDTAKAIGAVNLLVFGEDGKIHGENTDAFGFIENLNTQIPDFDYKDCTAMILGAGGAARAVLYALLQKGVKTIKISNRTDEKAQALIKGFTPICGETTLEHVSWRGSENHMLDVRLLVNATSLGMVGKQSMGLNLFCLQGGAVAYDLVYNPLMTEFLLDVEARGERIVTGLGMLLHQARPSFEAWTGTMPELDVELETLVKT